MAKLKSTYLKSFFVIIAIVLFGFILQYFLNNKEIMMPPFPANLFILLIFLAYLIVTFFAFKKTEILSWFIKIPSSIAVISVYTFLVLLMGFVPQVKSNNCLDRIGITHITSSFPFLIINVLLLMVLGYTVINRLTKKITIRNIAFFFNHAGLFIIIAGGYMGSSDMQTLSVPIKEGESTNIAFTDKNEAVKIPFNIKLNDFFVDEYPPEIMIYNAKTGQPFPIDRKIPAKKGQSTDLQSLKIEVLDYYPYAYPADSGFVSTDKFGSVHAALLKIKNDSVSQKEWVSTGNFMFRPSVINFNNEIIIELMEPVVKKFQSNIDLMDENKSLKNLIIEVNKPFNYNGWKIYQSSYDKQLGRWSTTSVFQMVKDPWLAVVYVGIVMLMLGSCYLIIAGRRYQ